MSVSASEVAARTGARRSGNWWRLLGVCHGARQADSLVFTDGRNGLYAYCHGGCDEEVALAMVCKLAGIDMRAYEQERPNRSKQPQARQRKNAEAVQQRANRDKERSLARANDLLANAQRATHTYLEAHGFGDYESLICPGLPTTDGLIIYEGWLMIPMRNYLNDSLQSMQFIPPSEMRDENKRFLAGCDASYAVHKLGSHKKDAELWFVEGYATGLSVQHALRPLGIPAAVWVTFSAGNLAKVARAVSSKVHKFVVADHDLWTCPQCKEKWEDAGHECPACGNTNRLVEPAGEKYARETELPYWMPPYHGDANDYMMEHGLSDLTNALSAFRRGK